MQYFKKSARYLILVLSLLACHYTYAVQKEEIVTKSVSQIACGMLKDTVNGLDAAYPYVNFAYQAYQIGQEIRKHNYPTKEEKAHAEKVAESFPRFTAEKEFQSCLMKNRSSSERNRSGRPVACEAIAQALNMFGGKSETNMMTAIYNQYRKENN